jgi:hypothetical protein
LQKAKKPMKAERKIFNSRCWFFIVVRHQGTSIMLDSEIVGYIIRKFKT